MRNKIAIFAIAFIATASATLLLPKNSASSAEGAYEMAAPKGTVSGPAVPAAWCTGPRFHIDYRCARTGAPAPE